MDLRPLSGLGQLGQRLYEDFDPSFKWVRDEGLDTLQIQLPGFRKEQVKVQLDNYGKIRISGECPEGNRWKRFRKDFQVFENANIDELNAKLENGILYVVIPKLITKVEPKQLPIQEKETPAKQKAEAESKATNDLPKPSQKATPITENRADIKAVKEDERSKAPAKVTSMKKEEEKKIPGEVKKVEEKGKGPARVISEKKEEGKSGDEGVGLNNPSQLLVNVVVAAMVIMALGAYVFNKSS